MSNIAMKQAQVRYNYGDYLLLPEDKHYEILDGELLLVPAPNIRHQVISLNLATALFQHVAGTDLGRVLQAPCDVVLSQEDIVQPDILFIRGDHAAIIGSANLQGPPDLVVEILSPATRSKDLELKRKTYARFGIQEYWIVDPEAETVEVLVWDEAGYRSAGSYRKSDCLSSSLLPDLSLPLSAVFAR
jgi:Uma2 family endonuclease